MIDQTWINPNFAQTQLVTLALAFLACLIIVPLVFAVVGYLFLGLLARYSERRRAQAHHSLSDEVQDE